MSRNSLPLKGRTFLITRTDEGNRVERGKLESLGAEVIELPVIEIRPPSDQKKIDEALDHIEEFDWIVFTSSNGVKAFFQRMEQKKKTKDMIKAKFACVGSQTSKALEERGFRTSLVPSEFLTLKLGQEMNSKFRISGQRVLLARAEEANEEITSLLLGAGAIVLEAPAYKTVIRKMENLDKNILDRVSDITLTSSSTVKGLISNFDVSEIKSRNIRIHCIGPVTAKSAVEAGLQPVSTATVHSLDGLIETVSLSA